MENVRFIGLDVHEESITLAVAESDGSAPSVLRRIPHDLNALVRALKDLAARARLEVAYEAGPTGWGIHHKLTAAGFTCHVVAPSRIPSDGRKRKNDAEDAIRLARFLRSGDLVRVYVPDAETEGLRALTRAREDALKAQQTARGQLRQFLVREGKKYDGKSAWTNSHLQWISSLSFDHPAKALVRDDYLREVLSVAARVARLTANVETAAAVSPLSPVITSLQALRGVQLVTAATVAAEVGDFRRFASAKHFMSFLGLVPTEHSSGERERRGSITKAGNAHLRRVLGESAWSYRFRTTSAAIQKRRNRTPPDIQAIAEKAQGRLSHKWERMSLRQKESNKIVIAVARELAGFIWAAGTAAQKGKENPA
jgi:transposase